VAAEHAPAHGIHDVAPAPDGGVFSTQASGHLGYFDPKTGRPSSRPPLRSCPTADQPDRRGHDSRAGDALAGAGSAHALAEARPTQPQYLRLMATVTVVYRPGS
jgi:hypothetical protein